MAEFGNQTLEIALTIPTGVTGIASSFGQQANASYTPESTLSRRWVTIEKSAE